MAITSESFEKVRVTDKATGHQINVARFIVAESPDRYEVLPADGHPTHDVSGYPVDPKFKGPKVAAKPAAKSESKAASVADSKN